LSLAKDLIARAGYDAAAGEPWAAPYLTSMPQTVALDDRAQLLLDLMREADDEAVTLDELAIAGVEDPAAALLALETAGFGLERVLDTTERGLELPCVRLARPTWPIDAPAPTLEFTAVRVSAPAAAPAPEWQPAPAPAGEAAPVPQTRRPVEALLALTLLGLVLVWLLRRAR
jgi:hypothetical protein